MRSTSQRFHYTTLCRCCVYVKLPFGLIAFRSPYLPQYLDINNCGRTCLGRFILQTFLRFCFELWNVTLDLTNASSKAMIMIAKLNIKYLKIRVEEGGKNYACCFTYMDITQWLNQIISENKNSGSPRILRGGLNLLISSSST